MVYAKYIRQNFPFLRDVTNCNQQVLGDCADELILTEEEKTLINQEERDQNSLFWTMIITKDADQNEENIIKKLADIFYVSGQNKVVQVLLKAIRDDGRDHQFAFVNNMQSLSVKVKQPTEPLNVNLSKDDCILSKLFVGLALIINITDYNKCGWKRHAATQDTKDLYDLLNQMGYEIIKKEGKFNEETFQCQIEMFLAEVQEVKTYKSYIIYVGYRGDEKSIFISGNEKILYNGFVQKFSTLEMDKPKLFIFQAVPGGCLTLFNAFDKYSGSDIKNTLMCYMREPSSNVESTINVGSWLLHNFLDVFMHEVSKKDLVTMMKIVKNNIQLGLGKKHKSLFVYKNFGIRNVYYDLSETEKNKYSKYITSRCTKLSKQCEKCDMQDVIEDCRENHIFSREDVTNLNTNDQIETKFWELISEKPISLSKLTDIFYHRGMFNVVKILHKATKDDNSDELYQDLKTWEPFKVEVVKPEKMMDFPDDACNLKEDFIGLALIINIIEYEIGFRRHGAEKDGTNMMELWSQMGYKIIKHEGRINKDKFGIILDEFINLVNRLNDYSTKNFCQSCAIYIGCHGRNGHIRMSDNHELELYKDFIFRFKALVPLNIPKIIVVQACRTHVQKPSFELSLETKENLIQMKPLIVCFSSTSGEESNRDVFIGSFYTYMFAKVFMEYAYKMELEQLLYRVENDLLRTFDEIGIQQKCYFQNYGMENLYFNIEPLKKN